MPAEEHDLSKCERKSQLSTNLVDPSVVTSSDSRSGIFLPEHTANISEEPSSVFTASQFQSQYVNIHVYFCMSSFPLFDFVNDVMSMQIPLMERSENASDIKTSLLINNITYR